MKALLVALIIALGAPAVAAASAPSGPPRSAVVDFDGDGISDLALVRPDGSWYIRPTGCCGGFSWGHLVDAADLPVPRDYDADRRTDLATFDQDLARWHIQQSSNGKVRDLTLGLPGDLPVPADYDGDGDAEPAVYRDGQWLFGSLPAYTSFGIAGDRPVPGDYDADGVADLAVYRDGLWIIRRSSDGTVAYLPFGLPGDRPIPADYDGDGRTDLAVHRPSGSVWWIRDSRDGTVRAVAWGEPTDLTAPADYNGDGRTDIAVYRPAEGAWLINGFGTFSDFGGPLDIPLAH
jgi:FG-GAP-like repeat